MKYSKRIRERLSEDYTITVKTLSGDDFTLDSNGFEAFCIMIVNMASENSTYISNDALKDLGRWVRTIKCTNCGEIMMGLDEDLKNSGYKRFYEGLLQSASMVSIETHGIL